MSMCPALVLCLWGLRIGWGQGRMEGRRWTRLTGWGVGRFKLANDVTYKRCVSTSAIPQNIYRIRGWWAS